MISGVCPARTEDRLCNWLKLSLSSPTCIKPHVVCSPCVLNIVTRPGNNSAGFKMIGFSDFCDYYIASENGLSAGIESVKPAKRLRGANLSRECAERLNAV